MNNRPVGRREDGKMDNSGAGEGKRRKKETTRKRQAERIPAGFPLGVRAAYRDRRVAQRVARVYVSAHVCPCVFLDVRACYAPYSARVRADNAR